MIDILTANDVQHTYPLSYYAAQRPHPAPHRPLKGEIKADVCVVGGGFTGLSAALHLARRGYDVALLDAHRVGWGASGRNGGQLGSGQRLDQVKLERMLGEQIARQLWDIAEEAKQLVKSLIFDHGINCNYTPGIIEADHKPGFVADSQRYVEKLNRDYGYDQISALDQAALRDHVASDQYYGGSLDKGAGHLDPLTFCFGLAELAHKAGTRIYEQSRVTKIEQGPKVRVHTLDGVVEADHVIMGCNGYIGGLERQVDARVMPINSFIVATEPLGKDRAKSLIPNNEAVADSRFVVNYFRLSPDHRLLFGGGESYSLRFPKDLVEISRKPMLQIFPQLADAKIDYAWGGTLGITMNRLPHFARLGPNIYSAAGFSGHGLGMATMSGKIMADMTQAQSERFDFMSRIPTPKFPGGEMMRGALLSLAMTYYALRDRF
ncbi:NAD(P)/FAD-dependent oxidoreductase [Maritalea myrionectae]|uniref:NAD(P)/FAD-dependent oxidoreductase n=1 Tax=Maritalea myrionectae TaxID=454601 RepID=UPI000409AC4F|nr:FAD-binding oxidoreductase [Maritalea myrionectae]